MAPPIVSDGWTRAPRIRPEAYTSKIHGDTGR
jgi:hypothetical protein